MKKLWSAKVWKFFYKYVFGIHCSSKLEIFSLVTVHATVPPIATVHPCYSTPRYISGQIFRFRPPQTLRPVSFSSSSFPLPNPTHLETYSDRNRPESGKVWATATRLFKILGFSISGKIGPHHLVDLEAHLTTNPTPPTLGKTTTGRRRIGELFRRGLPAFEVFLDLFRPFLDFVPVKKVDLRIVFVLVLKFRDHRRWSESGCVLCTRRRLGMTLGRHACLFGTCICWLL